MVKRKLHSDSLSSRILYAALWLLLLFNATWLRTYDVNWDEGTHLHPDERYMTMVVSAIDFPESLGQYWNTAESPLNPANNPQFASYVYGTLPLFVTRSIAGWVDQACWETPTAIGTFLHRFLLGPSVSCYEGLYTGYNGIHLIGRALSTLADLATLVGLAGLAYVLYGKRVALLAALLYAFAALPIQHAHFFVVDSFATVFVVWTLFFALLAVQKRRPSWLLPAGITTGLAIASKISVFPVAGVVALAMALHHDVDGEGASHYRFALEPAAVFAAILSGMLAALAFRAAQPYAFTGPGFFGVRINAHWMETMRDARDLANGLRDVPFGHQWTARTPIVFPWRNMVFWGMGLPLGLTAWIGWAVLGWRIFRHARWQHLLTWAWGTVFFLFQGTQWVKSMRYLLPIYPVFALFAGWVLARGFAWAQRLPHPMKLWQKGLKPFVLALPAVVVIGTGVWALAFLQIYAGSMTRVEASRWMYANIPTAITAYTDAGLPIQLPLSSDRVLSENLSAMAELFTVPTDSALTHLTLNKVSPGDTIGPRTFQAVIVADPDGEQRLAQTDATTVNLNTQAPQAAVELPFVAPVHLEAGQQVYLRLDLLAGTSVNLQPIVTIYTDAGTTMHVALPPDMVLSENLPSTAIPFTMESDGALLRVALEKVTPGNAASARTLRAVLSKDPYSNERLGETKAATVNLDTGVPSEKVTLSFPEPVHLEAGQNVYVTVDLLAGPPIRLQTSVIANEHWDDALPQRIDGLDPFGRRYRGLRTSPGGQMNNYDNDTPEKRQALFDWLDEADYIALSSNRLYGSIPRLPTRYPFTTAYYEALFNGSLGFELAAEFVRYPALGPCQFPDQEIPFPLMEPRFTNGRACSILFPPAEEAFSVYDHPTVLIFAKTARYTRERAEILLPISLLTDVEWVTPLEYTHGGAAAGDADKLLMTPQMRAEQESGGTWSQLFDRNALRNRFPSLAVVLWWLMLAALGLITFPWLYAAFPALRYRGYGLARAAGLLLWAYLAWILASLHVLPFTRLVLWTLFFVLAVASVYFYRARWDRFRDFFREYWRDVLWIEVIFAVLYVGWVFVRSRNPDLWHPVAGGEKPMDFAFLNAVIKSTWFPPYDPWFAGGTMNYYYFGFVMVASLIKALGIVPSVAYNLAVPAFYAMTGVGAYTLANNLAGKDRKRGHRAGVIGVFVVLILGNLGELRLIFTGLEQLGGVTFESLIPGYPAVISALAGLWKVVVKGEAVMFRPEWWYWNATRVVPPGPNDLVGVINEFPAFTFIYSDLHAHMMAFPLTQIALAIALQWGIGAEPKYRLERSKGFWAYIRRCIPHPLATFVLAGLVTGALRATNTWDWPTYLALMSVGLFLSLFKASEPQVSASPKAIVSGVVDAPEAEAEPVVPKPIFPYYKILTPVLFVLLGELLFRPYVATNVTSYTAFEMWRGARTSLGFYIIMHGQFLIPLSILAFVRGRATFKRFWKTRDAGLLLPFGLMLLGMAMLGVVLLFLDVPVAWAVIPLGAVATILVLDPYSSARDRLLWMWVGTALALTLIVEIVVLKGDIGRMNTVFKFYLQAWMLLALSAAVALERIVNYTLASYRRASPSLEVPNWLTDAVTGVVVITLAATAMYPLLAIPAKMRDRWAPSAPHTLDGAAFIPYATQHEHGSTIQLAVDDRVIRWMQENVEGSPTIIEQQPEREYLWGGRISVYTGLPSVATWRWHSVQQRLAMPAGTVEARQRDVRYFYSTVDPYRAMDILRRYNVQYVILTPYDEAYMLPEGKPKFAFLEERGSLEAVYRDEVSTVYKVNLVP